VVVQLLCLRRLLDDGFRPDLVLLEAHPWFLFRHYNTRGGEHYLPVSRFQFRDIPTLSRYDAKPDELIVEWVAAQWLPWYSHRNELQRALVAEWLPRTRRPVWACTDRHGWEGSLSDFSGYGRLSLEEQIKATKHHLDVMVNLRIDDAVFRAYRALVELCRDEGIEVKVVRMPEPFHLRARQPYALEARVETFYADLIRDTEVEVVDGRTWVADVEFLDGFHLLPRGSDSFSLALERRCLQPFLARYHSRNRGR
jgi:hypothetical protein